MKSEKIRIEVDLLRDSLRNIFVVMFAIMSGEIALVYRVIHNSYKTGDIVLFVAGAIFVVFLIKLQKYKKYEIKKLLEGVE